LAIGRRARGTVRADRLMNRKGACEMTQWDPKLDHVVLSKAWRAHDDDLPPEPALKAKPPALHFWLGDGGDRITQADAVQS
jgi:hypothetical protein